MRASSSSGSEAAQRVTFAPAASATSATEAFTPAPAAAMEPLATEPLATAELGESALLDQLHDLHRRLAAVRQDSQRYSSAARNLGPIPMASESNKIIVCSARRCVRMLRTNQDDSWQYVPSDTGFKSAVDYLCEGNNVQWISWPGAVVDESSQDGVRRKLESEYNCRPVFLTSEMLDLFHNQVGALYSF